MWGAAGGTCSAMGSHRSIARAGHHLTPRRLPSGRDVFQELGDGFTLINLEGASASVERLRDAAGRLHVPLRVVTGPDSATKDFYGRPLVLVRPDQFVAWAGSDINDAVALLGRVVGVRRIVPPKPPHGLRHLPRILHSTVRVAGDHELVVVVLFLQRGGHVLVRVQPTAQSLPDGVVLADLLEHTDGFVGGPRTRPG